MKHCQSLVLSILLLTTSPLLWGQGNKPRQPHSKTAKRQAVPLVSARADSLRGTLTPLRTCYDVGFYNLAVRVNLTDSTITGSNTIVYKVVAPFRQMQVDLFQNMNIRRITHNGVSLPFTREANAVFVTFPDRQQLGKVDSITVQYDGKPLVARNAPWDGGFVWTKDKSGKPWVSVACEGIGASLWWPTKDHPSDEPDSMYISCEVPASLVCVSNGNLYQTKPLNGNLNRYEWHVHYPINNYNVTLNIGEYTHFSDTYTSQDGDSLALDYYVMPYNEAKAREQFKQVKPMLACYEKYFGKYPFWQDGYALVETPYLGMEHQSAIAYGNGYQQGYSGHDLSGLGLKFDYIIVHESAHEYWGNSVTAADHAEMWIQESFTTYSEALYVECTLGYETALKYLQGEARLIRNMEPILGPMNVAFDKWKTSDHYFKGSLMLHTLRNAIGDDKLWFDILYGLSQTFQYKIIHTRDIINYINARTGKDFTYFFDQYLKYTALPTLRYQLVPHNDKIQLTYRWEAAVKGFAMPVKVGFEGSPYITLTPTTHPQTITLTGNAKDFRVATELFYIGVEGEIDGLSEKK